MAFWISAADSMQALGWLLWLLLHGNGTWNRDTVALSKLNVPCRTPATSSRAAVLDLSARNGHSQGMFRVLQILLFTAAASSGAFAAFGWPCLQKEPPKEGTLPAPPKGAAAKPGSGQQRRLPKVLLLCWISWLLHERRGWSVKAAKLKSRPDSKGSGSSGYLTLAVVVQAQRITFKW